MSCNVAESSCPSESEAEEIQSHLCETQKPAKLMGIQVDECKKESLTLSAPLDLNHNVHGTAFAGSLYSVAVLSAYYLGRAWLRREGEQLSKYVLVAKAGRIQYRKPVTESRIVAKSFLPSKLSLLKFRDNLLDLGKSSIEIEGHVIIAENIVACDFTVELCAYLEKKKLPRDRRTIKMC